MQQSSDESPSPQGKVMDSRAWISELARGDGSIPPPKSELEGALLIEMKMGVKLELAGEGMS